MKNKSNFVERIELELLSTLLDYVVPFVGKRINAPKKQQQKPGNLENLVNNNQKFTISDFRELENLLLRNLGENIRANKKIGMNSKDISYSLSFRRQKSKDEKPSRYSVSIKYEENQHDSKLKVSVKKSEKEVYSTEITEKREEESKIAPYKVSITYVDNYAEERLAITYKQQVRNYLNKHIQSKEDMTNMVPLKWLNILPESMMGGVLGFTYLGENFMGRRADLTGSTARMVDIHESIHTPDEYETRVLTSWIMEKIRPKYIR